MLHVRLWRKTKNLISSVWGLGLLGFPLPTTGHTHSCVWVYATPFLKREREEQTERGRGYGGGKKSARAGVFEVR